MFLNLKAVFTILLHNDVDFIVYVSWWVLMQDSLLLEIEFALPFLGGMNNLGFEGQSFGLNVHSFN